MKKPFSERFGDFMAGKGFYIVLFLCVAAIGISGYYLFDSLNPAQNPSTAVAGPALVKVTPTPPATPAPPAVTATPRPAPTPAAPSPSAAPEPAPSASQAPAPSTPVPTAPAAFTWPVRGETLTGYSLEVLAYDATMGDWRAHLGVDIAAPAGEQVLAPASGMVIDIVQDALMGTTVYMDHGGGLTSSCSNLAAVPAVEIGDAITVGDVLGSVGSTAIAESALPSHLHFEVAQDGLPVDPLDYLP